MNARSPLVAAAALAFAAAPVHAAQVWTATATEKIRPAAQARSTSSAEISAARNEFEAFQIGITDAATGVRATASDLAGPGGTIGVRLYREALIWLSNASALDGGTGSWPDPLVPAVDELAGEPRNAFPFDVPAGESRAIWAEVYVPADAAAGTYTGTVSLAWDGGAATVPLTLTVWPFALPSTASLRTAFGLYWGELLSGHGIPDGDPFWKLRARYGQLALDHRISLSHVDDGSADLGHLTSYYGTQLDGLAETSLGGARLTAFEYMGGAGGYASWASWFSSHGWSDRLFQYTCDEPPMTCQWSDIPARAASARAASPSIQTLVTTTIQDADAHGVTSSIDILVPVVNFMDDKGGPGSQRAAYDAFLAGSPSRELWMYQSCMSHGCGGVPNLNAPSDSDHYFTGWPTYVIDSAAPRNRAMEWLSFKYRATGELYYDTCMAYSHDPWTNPWDFSGNGDGTLFYPGTPARIGGATDIPLASIRLKLIREGMEDYEYLRILEDAGDGAYAHEVVDALFPNAYSTDVSPDALYAARAKLAARIVADGLGGSGSGSGSTPGPRAETGSPGTVVASGCASAGGAGLAALAGIAALAFRGRRRGARR